VNVTQLINRMRWPALLASAFLCALFISWQILGAVDFLYPVWHKVLHIDETVRIYGPQNHNRHGFEATTSEEHARLFAAIVRAVENGGSNLEALQYRDASGKPIDRLLTAPEIVHLRDVARLVRAFTISGWTSLLVFIVLTASLRMRPAPKPAMKRSLAYIGAIILLIVVIVSAIGPKDVFYKMHTLIFPTGHQWFFYYQESLMTTLMKAPDLFAAIAVEWLLLTMIVLALLLALPARLVPARSPDSGS